MSMDEAFANIQLLLSSPLASIGAALLLSQVIGVALHQRGLPKLYGAVTAGLLLGTSGIGIVDAPLLSQFQELLNAASALVLFEVGRKMDLGWLCRSRRQGMALLYGCLARGAVCVAVLCLAGVSLVEATLIGSILIAVNPIVYASMTSDSEASGVVTYAGANTIGLSNLLALLALSASLAWLRASSGATDTSLLDELLRQGAKLALGALIAILCYGLYAAATRITRAQASVRPGILLAALLMDLGLCSVSSSSALLSLLLMGLLLRNAESRENVFQAQIKTGQEIGYALLFMMSAALVDVRQVTGWAPLLVALLLFVLRVVVTRLALTYSDAWSRSKKDALALALCSLASVGSLVVDTSMAHTTGMSGLAASVMGTLLALNVLVAPGLTWWGLRRAGELREEN
jgi:hypothetical protein